MNNPPVDNDQPNSAPPPPQQPNSTNPQRQQARDVQWEEEIQSVYSPVRFEAYKMKLEVPPTQEPTKPVIVGNIMTPNDQPKFEPPDDNSQPQFAPPPQPSTYYPPEPQYNQQWQQPGTYPYQPPYQQPPYYQPPKKKSNGCLTAIVVVVAIFVALGILGSISNALSNKTASSPTSNTTLGTQTTPDAQATQNAQAVLDTNATQNAQPTDPPQPTDTPVPTPTFPPQDWTFTGNGIQKTTVFAPLFDTWQLSWTCDPVAYGFDYNLIVELYDINGNLVDIPVNVICKAGVTSGSTMEYNASGVYYLDVNSEGSWTIKVQTQ